MSSSRQGQPVCYARAKALKSRLVGTILNTRLTVSLFPICLNVVGKTGFFENSNAVKNTRNL